jgi:nucleoside-diphosphate-sugar epimerase
VTRSGDRPVVAVLGASGFVGSAVVAALAARPLAVRAVARRPVAVPEDARAEVSVHAADLTDPGALRDAVDGAGAVVHLLLPTGGWRADGEESERVNVGVMRDLVGCLRERAGRPPVVVFAGSVSQAGPVDPLPVDGSEPDRPESPYDLQKQAAERLLVDATADGVLRGISLRLPTVYGSRPGSGRADRGVLAAMARRALAGQPLTVWGDGAVLRDVVHVEDVAAAFVAALDHADRLAGRHWVVGTGEGRRLRDLFTAVAAAVSESAGRPPVPVQSVPPPSGALRTDTSGVVVDASAFAAVTGWRPRVPLRAGLDRMVAALAGERVAG